ncbi:MAG: Fic family protein [Chryseobacterium sp.]
MAMPYLDIIAVICSKPVASMIENIDGCAKMSLQANIFAYGIISKRGKSMRYLSVVEVAKKWNMSERGVRNYCAQGKIVGAFLTGKTWNIPEEATRPNRILAKDGKSATLLDILKAEKSTRLSGGIYHKIQIDLTYNSNHIEGSKLSHDQTRYIFETNTISIEGSAINVDDIVETVNHFKCIDLAIDNASASLSEKFIKTLHQVLKNGTTDSRKEWFVVGDYKKLPNEVGGNETASPKEVCLKMKELLLCYNQIKEKTFEELLDFHYKFESIHPFQDGNGRVGRLIMFKECLKNNITPFIIDEELKLFYYRGLNQWQNERGFLMDTCLLAQDKFKKYLDYFEIKY